MDARPIPHTSAPASPRRLAASLRISLCAPAIVIAFTTAIFLFHLGSARTLTHHEAYLVQSAREMLATGDWLIPRIAGEPWLEKPPLPQWLVAGSARLLGRCDEFAARLPAALCGILGVLAFTSLVGRRRTPAVALIAGLMLASSTYVVTYARLAESDIFLWATVLLAFATFARGNLPHDETAPRSFMTPLLFFALVGLTQLSKGLLFGAVMVLAPCGVWLLLDRFRSWRWFLSPVGWLLGAAVAAAWPAAVVWNHPDAWNLWLHHTLGRLDAATAINPKPVWYYFTTLPWQAAPWIALALPALPRSLRAAWHEPRSLDRFAWVWFVTLFAVLSIATGKHHHYLIYALPPIALLAADALPWWRDRLAQLWAYSLWRWTSTPAMVGAIAVAAWRLGEGGVLPAWEFAAVGGAVLAALVVLARACLRGNDRAAVTALFILVGGLTTYANAVWLPRTDIYRPDGELIQRLNARVPAGETVLFFGVDSARPLIDLERPFRFVHQFDPPNQRGMYVVTYAFHASDLMRRTGARKVDETPAPKWAGNPMSHLQVYQLPR